MRLKQFASDTQVSPDLRMQHIKSTAVVTPKLHRTHVSEWWDAHRTQPDGFGGSYFWLACLRLGAAVSAVSQVLYERTDIDEEEQLRPAWNLLIEMMVCCDAFNVRAWVDAIPEGTEEYGGLSGRSHNAMDNGSYETGCRRILGAYH